MLHTRSRRHFTTIRHRVLCLLLTPILSLHALLLLIPTAHAAPASTLSLSAQAAILVDADSGNVLYEQNAATRLPMASTTKIMTALVVAERLAPSTPIRIDRRAVGIEGSSIYLYEGEWLTVEQLLLGLLLESANDAAVALALATADDIAAFAELMNQKAAELGLINTHFENPHGLDADTHYTTAHDLAKIAAEALKNPTLRRIMATRRATIPLCDMNSPDEEIDLATGAEPSVLVGTRVLLNHNKMLRYYEGAIGVKTGYTKKSGRCLVSAAQRDGLTLIAVTLNAPDDWNDHSTLLDYGFSRYVRISLCKKGEYQTMLPVSGGREDFVMVANRQNAAITLPREHAAITCRVQLPRFLLAPVASDDRVGELVFLCDTDGDGKTEKIATVPLYTTYGVPTLPKPTLLSRICRFFRDIFT
jgi:D-alanyl-D-alanine carboxypeptidase